MSWWVGTSCGECPSEVGFVESEVGYCITFTIGLGSRIGNQGCEQTEDRGVEFQQGVHTGLVAETKGC